MENTTATAISKPTPSLVKAWQGRLSLAHSLWLTMVGGYCVLSITIVILLTAILYAASILPFALPLVVISSPFSLMIVCGLLHLVYVIYSTCSVWRCANNWKHWIGWKYISRIAVLLTHIALTIKSISLFAVVAIPLYLGVVLVVASRL